MVTNKQIALVFREAKKDLRISSSTHNSKYICLAIKGRSNLPIEHREAAIAIIEERLEGKHTLEDWLASKGVSYEDMSDTRLHAHRRIWLNTLIMEFSKLTTKSEPCWPIQQCRSGWLIPPTICFNQRKL